MLIIKKIDFEAAQNQGRWFGFDFWGDTLNVKIRPRTDEVVHAIKDRHKGTLDDRKRSDAIFEDLIDFIVEDFKGVADEGPEGAAVPWPVTRDTKMKLIALKVPTGEKPLMDRILDQANALEFEVRKEDQKN